jgi:hypothetical protein
LDTGNGAQKEQDVCGEEGRVGPFIGEDETKEVLRVSLHHNINSPPTEEECVQNRDM